MNQTEITKIVNEVLQELNKTKASNENKEGVPLKKTDSAADIIDFTEQAEMAVDEPKNKDTIQHAQKITPARIGIGRSGTRMKTKSYLQFRIDHAAAQDAVLKDVEPDMIKELNLPVLQTKAEDMETYLMDLEAGRTLNDESIRWLKENGEKGKQIQIIICDGLSSTAVESNTRDLLPAIVQGLSLKGITYAKPLFVKRSRVWVQDHVAKIVDSDIVISLIGERPGLATAESLSAYMVYRPGEHTVEADRTVISNIHKGGLSPVEAGAHLADLLEQMLQYKASGVQLVKHRNKK
ncbi:ethanolamine ammonia-lyase subunit EutC [Fictibacillus fluitans]|uniref:Ethanolamine ammonia-lyase small subunit n=1 Tax=Fictibacillus fluitans TaxID=3058422 RepID=A0ABT8I0V3_9BACL|nr:ethanolamine ammonia-lyase subunit EutC [Fictibacillus sp. NE201]MDN4526626.1 ethanolamine ammonia-lyase subunit EutC [Fictibacillus sp. NE201]